MGLDVSHGVCRGEQSRGVARGGRDVLGPVLKLITSYPLALIPLACLCPVAQSLRTRGKITVGPGAVAQGFYAWGEWGEERVGDGRDRKECRSSSTAQGLSPPTLPIATIVHCPRLAVSSNRAISQAFWRLACFKLVNLSRWEGQREKGRGGGTD